MIFCVKVYINKEMTNISFYTDLDSAMNYANICEDRAYICEIEVYDYHKTITREFWRETRDEREN